MKHLITTKQMDSILDFIKKEYRKKFKDEDIETLKSKFCINPEKYKDLVYWYLMIDVRGYVNEYEGTISKSQYEKILKHPDFVFNIETSKHGDNEIELSEIEFSEDIDKVIDFATSDRREEVDLWEEFTNYLECNNIKKGDTDSDTDSDTDKDTDSDSDSDCEGYHCYIIEEDK